MALDRHHFHFFGNREITSLYFTLGVLYFAEGLMSIFVPIYFWKLGFPLWRILFFYFLTSAFFVALTFAALPIIRKLSDKIMMISSIPFLILYFLGIGVIADAPFLFYILPFFVAVSALLFNVGYHMDFSASADDGYIGREVGMRYMVGALSQFASPLLGGFLIVLFGFKGNFIIGSAIMLLAVLPLFFFPRRGFSSHLDRRTLSDFLKDKRLAPFTASGIGYAIESSISRVIWPLFIFLSIGSIQYFGGVISAGLLGGAAATYLVGFLSDRGQRRKALKWSTGIFSLIWIARPFFVSPFLVVGSHVGGNIINSTLMVSWSSQYYKIARAISKPDLFILSREVLYHISRIVFLPVLMVLSYLLSLNLFFLVSFFAAALFTSMFIFANRTYTQDVRDI